MKNGVKIFYVSLIITIVVIFLNFIFFSLPNQNLMKLELWGIYFFYSFVLTAVNSLYFDYLGSRYSWNKVGALRMVAGALGSILITIAAFFLCRLIHLVFFTNTFSLQAFLAQERISNYVGVVIFTAVVSLFFHLIYFYKALQEDKVKEQKIIAGTASAKFDALKNQLDPHFLFNSLNVLTSLIEENPDAAQKFTTSLSKIYRYVLEQKDKDLVSIQEELKFAEVYISLLKMRFENSIFYEVNSHIDNPDAKVVPLSLQLLLENTVKHNVVSENAPLYIKVYEKENYLIVENNFQKKEVMQSHRGVGLINIVDRYGLISVRKVIIEENPKYFRVKLPILTKQITVMETNEKSVDNAYYKAKERVKEIKEFYGNVLSYCVVIPFLIFINYRTYWEFQWFWFPLFGWGLGLAIHAFSVFGYGAGWEERKIREIMEKENNHNNTWK